MVQSRTQHDAWQWILVALTVAVCAPTVIAESGVGGPAAAAPAHGPTATVAWPDGPACSTPRFVVSLAATGGSTFAGSVDGDLVGMVEFAFAGAAKVTGVTIANQGTARWVITEGLGPEAVTFETTFENRNQATDRPGSASWIYENVGAHRERAGVAHVRWTYHGAFDGLSGTAVHEYRGVICAA